MGVVKGNVIDTESSAPVSNVIIRLDERKIATDKNGKFTFRGVRPGRRCLTIDRSTLGAGRTTVQKPLLDVHVKKGEERHLSLGIVRTATITGCVNLYHYSPRSDSCETSQKKASDGNSIILSPRGGKKSVVADTTPVSFSSDRQLNRILGGGLAGVLVRLDNNRETLWRATDASGRFSFEDVRPGVWTLSVYESGLPVYHYVEQDHADLQLGPGEKRNIEFRVLPKKRKIRFQESGGAVPVMQKGVSG